MTGTYTAVEVSEPGKLQVVERPLPSRRQVRCAFAWRLAASVIPMRPQSPARTLA